MTTAPPPAQKPRWPRAAAIAAARDILPHLEPATTRLIVAGSLRRRRPDVGDVEILYIPRWQHDSPVAGDMFARASINLADRAIAALEAQGILTRRQNAIGSEMFGPQNKLMRHTASGIPIDLFATNETSWYNYLVCRTGPADSNTRIASAARTRGWRWNPYGPGFTRPHPAFSRTEIYAVTSEADVFSFVGLPHLPPWERT